MPNDSVSLTIARPTLPQWLINSLEDDFIPATEMDLFVRETFLNEESRLFNPDHIHLQQARIGYLWTNAVNRRQMRSVVGICGDPETADAGRCLDESEACEAASGLVRHRRTGLPDHPFRSVRGKPAIR
jgi:hypothetical protein